jgi:hypothetical protein
LALLRSAVEMPPRLQPQDGNKITTIHQCFVFGALSGAKRALVGAFTECEERTARHSGGALYA